MYIVELEKGVWLAPGIGDPPKTLKRKNSLVLETLKDAEDKIKAARLWKLFPDAKIHRLISTE